MLASLYAVSTAYGLWKLQKSLHQLKLLKRGELQGIIYNDCNLWLYNIDYRLSI